MPAMKKMKKNTIGKKGQLNTNTTNPGAGKADSRKGFVMGNAGSISQGAGKKPGGYSGKAMGTAKGRGGVATNGRNNRSKSTGRRIP